MPASSHTTGSVNFHHLNKSKKKNVILLLFRYEKKKEENISHSIDQLENWIHLWGEKVTQAVGHPCQSDATKEENDQNDVWKCGGHVHDL